jgi:transcriptional antiterminator
MRYLNNNKIVYRRNPINDNPTKKFWWGNFYKDGTHECYELFRSKAKITSYKSLKWHLLVLWYLNPQLTQDKFENLSKYIVNKENNFITFKVPEQLLKTIIYEVSMMDLEYPPKNKLRKVIFKDVTGLSKSDKLSIVGKLIGRGKKITSEDIYETMLLLNDNNKKITIAAIAEVLSVSTRTVYRNMSYELTKEKELLNEEI